jgi:hypothetical protein
MSDATTGGTHSGRDLELAELLDACLRAEHDEPGAAARLLEAAPPELRTDLRELVQVAQLVQRSLPVQPTDAFRRDARERLQARIGAAQPKRRQLRWWWQSAAAGLVGLSLLAYGTTTVAAGSLPGEPLYGVKRATEFVALERVRDDVGRARVLVDQAGIRLDECSRLSSAGQTDAAMAAAEQYVATLREATALMLAARPKPDQQALDQFARVVGGQQQQLQLLAGTAPEVLRPSLESASNAATTALEQDLQVNGGATPPPGPTASKPSPAPRPAVSPSLTPTNSRTPGTGAPSPLPAVSPLPQRASPSTVASPAPGQR